MGSMSLNLLGGSVEAIETEEDGHFIIRKENVSYCARVQYVAANTKQRSCLLAILF